MFKSAGAIVCLEFRLARKEPLPVLMGAAMALIFSYFLRPVFHADSNLAGGDRMVAGFAIMFAFFMVSTVAASFFNDHNWGTWERARLAGAGMPAVILGKTIVPFVSFCFQMVLIFGFSRFLFHSENRWSVGLISLFCAILASYLVFLGIFLTFLCGSLVQVSSVSSLLAPVLACLGGALFPVHLLPWWIQQLAPISPTFWVMKGLTCGVSGGCDAESILSALGFSMAHVLLIAGFALGAFRLGFRPIPRMRI